MLARLGISLTIVSTVAAPGACAGGSRPNALPDICALGARPPSLMYPADGATNVPDGNFVLVIDENATGGFLAIGGNAVTPTLAPTAVPSPLPSAQRDVDHGRRVRVRSSTAERGDHISSHVSDRAIGLL